MIAQIDFRERANHAFRKRLRLDLEGPPEIAGRKLLRGLVVRTVGWCDVQHDAAGHGLRMIGHHELQSAAAAVVTHGLELFEAEGSHDLDLV